MYEESSVLKLKNVLIGLLLCFQFFTSFPIRKELPMNKKTVTSMFAMMPFMSLLMGFSVCILVYLNEAYFHFSPLFLAIIIVVFNLVMTGGLHLDGWIDLSDAFFSYRDREKRLEILSDSRVGAFGAISLVVMILLKIGVLYELLIQQLEPILLFFVIIPFLCRIAMLLYFNTTANVKNEGLAAYFKNNVDRKTLWIFVYVYIGLFFMVSFIVNSLLMVLLLISMFIFYLLYRKWTKHHFGGLTGDLLGALYEGMELVLWGMLLLFI